MRTRDGRLIKDLFFVIISVAIALALAKTGALRAVLDSTRGLELLESFVAGMFFTSVFTTAIATVVLGEIAQSGSLVLVAFFGGLGALIGDLVIFLFIKDRLAEDFRYLIQKTNMGRLTVIFKLRIFRWLIPMLGALVVASPLPDELGLAMMGLSKMKTSLFVPLSFILNATGILIIGLIARTHF